MGSGYAKLRTLSKKFARAWRELSGSVVKSIILSSLILSLIFSPSLLSADDKHETLNPQIIETGVEDQLPAPEDFRQLEDLLVDDIQQWDPRKILGPGSYSVEYQVQELRRRFLETEPELDPELRNWENTREETSRRISQISESMLNALDATTLRLGISALLNSLRNLEIDRNHPKLPKWERLANWLNPSLKSNPKVQTEFDRLSGEDLLTFKKLFETYDGPTLRNMIHEIGNNPHKDFSGDMGQLHLIIDAVGVSEAVREISNNRLGNLVVDNFGRGGFSSLNGQPIVKFVLFGGKGRSFAVMRRHHFMKLGTRHEKQFIARQLIDTSPVDEFGRKQGRPTAFLVQDRGVPYLLVEHEKPETFAARMHNYFYATDKGASRWKTMFGVTSGLVQGGATYLLASWAGQPHVEALTALSIIFGSGIGAKLSSYLNWLDRGTQAMISYRDLSWKTETNPFKRYGKQLRSIAFSNDLAEDEPNRAKRLYRRTKGLAKSPTLTSRYLRSLSVTIAFATLFMGITHWGEMSFTSIAGIGGTLWLAGTEIIPRIATNSWISNLGKSSIEEVTNLLRRNRVLTDEYSFFFRGKKVQTDLPKVQILHQMLYNSTNNFLKLADYAIKDFRYIMFSIPNFLNLVLQTVMLRIAARMARDIEPENSRHYYRLYHSSILNILMRLPQRLYRGEIGYMAHSLSKEEEALILQELSEIKTLSDLQERKVRETALEVRVLDEYYRGKEERLDKIIAAFQAKSDGVKRITQSVVTTVVRPFAPPEIQEKLPSPSMKSVLKDCRLLLTGADFL